MALAPFPGATETESDEALGPYAANSAPPVATSSSPFAGGDDEEPPEGRITFLEHLD